jgi:dimethylargininase
VRVALTRAVPPSMEACELTHLERQPIDLARARVQHAAYERTLADLGCHVVRLPETPELPDSVFVEDTAVVVDELAVLTRPGAVSRRPEVDTLRAALLPWRRLARIEPPGILDGGDVLQVGRRVYVGRGTRTDDEGIRQLRALLSPFGYSVQAVTFAGCLHLKTAVTGLDDHTLLLNPEWVAPASFAGLPHLTVDPSEPMAANVLRVGETLLCGALYPRTADRLARTGLSVQAVDASELAKAEGGLTCCSVIFEGEVGLEGLEPSTSRL